VCRVKTPVNQPSLKAWLKALFERGGLSQFVAHVMPAFNLAVGHAWQNGQLGVHAEHDYTETLRQVVTRAPHAQLRLAGADVIDLGTQLPATEIIGAVHNLLTSVVDLSISACLGTRRAQDFLQALKPGLPAHCVLWVGGQGCAALSAGALHGCEVFDDTSSAVRRWQGIAVALQIQL